MQWCKVHYHDYKAAEFLVVCRSCKWKYRFCQKYISMATTMTASIGTFVIYTHLPQAYIYTHVKDFTVIHNCGINGYHSYIPVHVLPKHANCNT